MQIRELLRGTDIANDHDEMTEDNIGKRFDGS
jgi:hypothetical protein